MCYVAIILHVLAVRESGGEFYDCAVRNNRSMNIIEAGSVITIEPGVYLPGIGGVRLEDYGVETEDGYEPFTQSSHELQVIECKRRKMSATRRVTLRTIR